MRLPFAKIISFASTKPHEVKNAISNFFEGDLPGSEEEEEKAEPLFNEWLIFDYKQTTGVSFLTEYCLKNPDNLPLDLQDSLKQVLKTFKYSLFEIQGSQKSRYIKLEDLQTGKRVTVWDVAGSTQSPQGSIYARLAKINNKWYFVGANPILLPITHTQRAKKLLKKTLKNSSLNPRDTWQLIKKGDKQASPRKLTQKELKNLQKKLRRKYERLQKRYNCKLPFNSIINEIHRENVKSHYLDFWQTLIKKGLPKKFFFDHAKLFEKLWNYFPHKCIGNKSPYEVFTKLKTYNKT